MKRKRDRLADVEPPAIDKALAERSGTAEIVYTVLTRFHRKGCIPGLLDGPRLLRIATSEYHRE